MKNANATDTVIAAEVRYVFHKGIDQDSVRDFVLWAKPTPAEKGIRLELNSQGGGILDCISLFEEVGGLRKRGHKVTVAVLGRAASCAGWVLQGADKRIIGEHSWVLIHEVHSEVKFGPRSAIAAELARVDALQNQTYGILCSRTKDIKGGLTLEMINEHCSTGQDWWIDAPTALELGLVDAIEYAPVFEAPAIVANPTTTAA
ncbi:MAG: ATP-dependent Clp protease proteolytic subunit [Candidatus Melainabacteria bacterium]|nr:ATP-dependent Clp protease proteolytic subunit [Candidatus Melainabacteria bacterium]